MSKQERATRAVLAQHMRKQGYVTYAGLFLKFELNFHKPKRPFAAMVDADKGIIYINPDIADKDSLSILIRHEILHQYLAHQDRVLKHYAKQKGMSYEVLEDIPLEKLMNMTAKDFAKLDDDTREKAKQNRMVANDLYRRDYNGMPYHNVIKDAEISNRGYTEADKAVVKNLEINGIPFPGIVTDSDFPEWVGMSVEEMMDAVEVKIAKEKEEAEKAKKDKRIYGKMTKDGIFISSTGNMYGKKRK